MLGDFQSATVARVNIAPAVGDAAYPSPRGRIFTIPFTLVGTVGSSPVKAAQDLEFPFEYRVLAGFADALTAPSSTYSCGIVLSDGTTSYTVTISTTATHGENKTPAATPMLANTDTDITLTDDNASATTQDISGFFLCEEL